MTHTPPARDQEASIAADESPFSFAAPLVRAPLSILAAYPAFFRKTFAVQLQYRASLLIWLIGSILEPVIYLAVWSTVAASGDGAVGGFTPRQFAAYYIAMMLVDHLTFTWIMWEYDYRIRLGQLSSMLLRPIHPVHEDIADNLTYKILTAVIMIPVTALLFWAFRPEFNTSLWAGLAFIPALGLSFLLRFLTGWALAMLAFWTSRIQAINNTFFVAELFLAGRIAPLTLLPAGLQTLASLLPFRWGLAFPVELILGRLTPGQTLLGFGAQLVWLGLAYLFFRLIWRAGIRRYAAFGS